MPLWDSSKGDIAYGNMPASLATQFGSATGTSTAYFAEEGTLFRFVSAGTAPAATAADVVLFSFSIPANAFDVSGRGLTVTAQGTFANNTNTKTAKIIFNPTTAVVGSTVGSGGTTVVTTGAYSTTGLTSWLINGSIYKYGIAGSNTQISMPQGVIIGGTHTGVGSAVTTLATATESAAILVAVTGNAATTATDILLQLVVGNANN